MIASNDCERCWEERHHILPSHHLPKWNFARSRKTGKKICDICARAEALMQISPALTFSMARQAMQNEYEENLRLPKGMGMGIFQLGINKFITDLEVEAEIYESDEEEKSHGW